MPLKILSLILFLIISGEFLWVVFPGASKPAKSDEIVVLGPVSFGFRLQVARSLSRRYPSAAVLVSTARGEACPGGFAPPATVVCFHPDPFTTRGEARYAANYAKESHLRSILVVTTAEQVRRARLRFSRCWPGELLVVRTASGWSSLAPAIPYEIAASLKAQLIERSC
jgi:uncharacterized SAM-binding protein YcdF (DUF218 family)